MVRNDAPVTAILNLVFRPQTPEKKRGDDLGAVGDQIDLIIESRRRNATSRRPRRRSRRPRPPGPASRPPNAPTR